MLADTKRFSKGMFWGILFSAPLWAVIIAGVATLAGCTTPAYEVCDTPNCGDNVTVVVTE